MLKNSKMSSSKNRTDRDSVSTVTDMWTQDDEKSSDDVTVETCAKNSSKFLDAKNSTMSRSKNRTYRDAVSNVTRVHQSVDEMFATMTQMVRLSDSETTGTTGLSVGDKSDMLRCNVKVEVTCQMSRYVSVGMTDMIPRIDQSVPCHNESVHGSYVPDGTTYGGVSCGHAHAVSESMTPLHQDGACVTINRYSEWVDSIEHASARLSSNPGSVTVSHLTIGYQSEVTDYVTESQSAAHAAVRWQLHVWRADRMG